MINSRQESFRIQALQLTDAILVWAAFWLGWELRDVVRHFLGLEAEGSDLRESIYWVLYIAVPLTPLVLERFGFYGNLRSKSASRSALRLFQGILVIILLIGVFSVFAKLLDTRRLALGLGFSLVFVFLFIRDRVTSAWLRGISSQDSGKERVVLAGSEADTQALLAELDPEVTEGWKIVSFFDLQERPVRELFDVLKEQSVSRVIFAAKETGFDKVARAVEACELQGVEAWIAASFIRTQIARPVFDALGSKPMLVLRSTPELSWELMAKETIDRIGSFLLIVATLPLCVIAAVGIRIASPGAPFMFSQMRAGRYGKPFRMWKFRTMVANAEQLLDQVKEDHGNQMDGPVFKLTHDPRIFPFGAMLRKFSIDELPQLLNVVMGDMSLVGPRPLPVYEVEAFGELSHRRRLSVKPGITCEWQAGGRNKISNFEEWVAMDLKYIDNWSLWLDIKILIRTIPAVIFGKGAA